MAENGKKRKAYEAQFKKQVLQWYIADDKRSLNDTSRHFGLKLDTVKTFYRNHETILKSDDTRKKMRGAHFPGLEGEVLRFVKVARSLRLPVTAGAIQLKALSLREKFGILEDPFMDIRKAAEIEELEKEAETRKSNVSVLKENTAMLEKFVADAAEHYFHDEVFSRMVEALRIQRQIQKQKERAAAPKKQQAEIQEFFRLT